MGAPAARLDGRRLRRGGVLALFAGCAALLALHARYYWPFLSDDALISLRYAERFASGHGLTWTDGERVEGYTDFLWVLLTALPIRLGADPIATARALDALGALAALALTSCTPRPLALRGVRVLSGGLGLALLAPLAVWSIGALEHGFMAGVIAAALVALARALGPGGGRGSLTAAGLALAALALLRADGVVLALAGTLGALLAGRPSRATLRRAALVGLPTALALAAQLAFRLAYYRQWVPNTALAKVSLNAERLTLGLEYVRDGAKPLVPMIALALALTLAGWRELRRERWLPAATMTLGWSAYVALVGGDIFPAWRQLLPAMVPLAMLIAEGAEACARRHRLGALGAVAVALPLLGLGFARQHGDGTNRRGKTERWEWDGLSIGPMLGRAFGKQKALLAVDAAGALPYWSKLPSLDMLGLNDRFLASHPPRDFGHGAIGHELGNGAYVFERRPDIIAFNNAAGAPEPGFRSGRELLQLPAFRAEYQRIRVRGAGTSPVTGWLWLRREGGPLGVSRAREAIRVPGYFFAGGEAEAGLDEGARLVTRVSADAGAKLPTFALPAGAWRLELEAPAAGARVRYRCDGRSALPPSDVIELDAPRSVDALVAGADAPFSIDHAVFRRVPGSGGRCPRGGHALELSAEALPPARPDGLAWDAAENVLFDTAGVRVTLPEPSHAGGLELALDANDGYEVEFYSGRRALERASVPVARGSGLVTRRLLVPEPAALIGFDALEVRPARGDGYYSMGHLALTP
ncbi:MAG: hypothetical protein OZ921_02425 [Sorangiineae bacterium]|nr:hypothetical protein [Polyangiaceae bacterium]MEB2321341.1 hypothetical protein [Sorangiineae bacterium]